MGRLARYHDGVVARVKVTITQHDGSTITYEARQPPRFDLGLTFPDRLSLGLSDVPPVEITMPPPVELTLTFAVNPCHGITVERQPAREDEHHG